MLVMFTGKYHTPMRSKVVSSFSCKSLFLLLILFFMVIRGHI